MSFIVLVVIGVLVGVTTVLFGFGGGFVTVPIITVADAALGGDAVRVARMDAEVLVVDGRPRYHLADCRHLVGRLTEALPAAEAVELGFSPCGLCRPVDRLVAQAAHR